MPSVSDDWIEIVVRPGTSLLTEETFPLTMSLELTTTSTTETTCTLK